MLKLAKKDGVQESGLSAYLKQEGGIASILEQDKIVRGRANSTNVKKRISLDKGVSLPLDDGTYHATLSATLVREGRCVTFNIIRVDVENDDF